MSDEQNEGLEPGGAELPNAASDSNLSTHTDGTEEENHEIPDPNANAAQKVDGVATEQPTDEQTNDEVVVDEDEDDDEEDIDDDESDDDDDEDDEDEDDADEDEPKPGSGNVIPEDGAAKGASNVIPDNVIQ